MGYQWFPHISCFVLCLFYTAYLGWRAYATSKNAKESVGISQIVAIICPIVYSALAVAFGMSTRYFKKVYKQVVENKYFHLPTMLFVMTTIWNYGITLHHTYWNINPINPEFIAKQGNDTIYKSCASLNIDLKDFIPLQLGVPMLIFIQAVYFMFGVKHNSFVYLHFTANMLNTMDIMDLVTDVGCIQNHPKMYRFFYVAEFLSVFLIPFSFDPKGIEERESDNIRKQEREFTLKWKIGLTVATTLSSDLFPLIIRCYIMAVDQTQSGVNFVVKESVSVIFYCIMIWRMWKELGKMLKNNKKDAADRVLQAFGN